MQTTLATLPIAPTGHAKRARAYSQAVDLQTKLAEAVGICRDDMSQTEDREVRARIGSALASMVRGWDILEERKRILRGRPLPGHLRPDLPASQRKPTKRIALLATMVDESKESIPPIKGSGHPPTPEAQELT